MEKSVKRKLQEADVPPRNSSEPKKAGDQPALKRTKACVLTKPKEDFTIPGLEPAEERTPAWVLSKLFKYSDEEKEDLPIPGLEPAEEKAAACVLNKLFRYSDEEKDGFSIGRKMKALDGGEPPEKRSKDSSESSSSPVTWESDSSAPNLQPSESGTKHKDGDAELSEEEKIYKMSSSTNKSQADFKSKYEVLGPLGKGGYGMVYSGFRKSDKLPVAIKYINAANVRRQEVICNGTSYNVILEVAFMLKATGLTGEVGQSAAVSLLDWYFLDDRLVLVMERPTPCMDLLQHLKKRGGKLCQDEAKDILRQLVDVTIDMESKGIFHQDIKPHNVLIQSQSGVSRVRLIDFGCASFSSETCHHFCGTRLYAPPEWLYCGAYQACPTTVWQLGVLFYSLLHGAFTFTTKEFLKGAVEFNWKLSKESKLLLRMCLVENPEHRSTLQQLQRLLETKTDFYRVY